MIDEDLPRWQPRAHIIIRRTSMILYSYSYDTIAIAYLHVMFSETQKITRLWVFWFSPPYVTDLPYCSSFLPSKFSWLFAACLPHGVHNVMSTAGNAGPKTAETVRYTRRRRKSSFNRSTPIFKDAQPPAASPPPEDTYWARVEAEV